MKRTNWIIRHKPIWVTRSRVSVAFAGTFVLFLIGLGYTVDWTGFSKDVSDTKVDRKVTTQDKKGNKVETVITTTIQDPKKLWDWLSLLGVQLALAVFAVWLEGLQQRAVEKQKELDEARKAEAERVEKAEAERKTQTEKEIADQKVQAEKEIAESKQQEEAFQNYIDRMSALLVDKNLITIADQGQKQNWPYPEQKDLLEASVCVIRARTLSILRRLHGNSLLKADVIRFLIDSEVLTKLRVDLRDADLRGVDLSDANFSEINFTGAKVNFRGVKFHYCNFRKARFNDSCLIGREFEDPKFEDPKQNPDNKIDFREATFEDAVFIKSDFSQADFRGCWLRNAVFDETKLMDADFREASLGSARFSGDFSLLEKCKFNGAWLDSTSFKECSGAIMSLDKLIGSAKLCQVVFPTKIMTIDRKVLNPDRDCGGPPRFLLKSRKVFEEN